MKRYLIFTDLDGSILHRDTFKFDQIKDYIKKLINSGVHIIPNSSKTESEIIEFNQDLGENLAYISILIGLIGLLFIFWLFKFQEYSYAILPILATLQLRYYIIQKSADKIH